VKRTAWAIAWIVDHPIRTLLVVFAVSAALAVPIVQLKMETDLRGFMSKSDPVVQRVDRAEALYGRTVGLTVMLVNGSGVFNRRSLAAIERMETGFGAILGVKEVRSPLSAQVITGTSEALSVAKAAPGGRAPDTDAGIAALRERIMDSRLLRDAFVSSDERAAAISVELAADADEAAITDRMLEIIGSVGDDADAIYLNGDAYFDTLISEGMGRDWSILFPSALLAITVILFLTFLNGRGVAIPLLVVVLSVILALGIMALVGFPMTVVSFIAPVLLLAIGIADGIHILNRYSEALATGLSKRTAILVTMDEMRGPVVMTSLTTSVAFLSLLSSFFLPQRHFGVIAAIGVIAAMTLSLVAIPAVLSLLKPTRVRARGRAPRPLTRALLAFERLILRRHRVVLAVGAVLLVGTAAALPLLRVETANEEMLGPDHPAVRILQQMDDHFSGAGRVLIEIDTEVPDGLKDPAVLTNMLALEAFLASEGIHKTISLTDLVREMNQRFHANDPDHFTIPEERSLVSQLLLLFTFQGGSMGDMALGDFSAGTILGLYPTPSTAEMSDLARRIQTYLDENFTGSVTAEMIGETVLMDRVLTRMNQSQFVGLGTTIGAVGVIVMLLMESIVAGLIALIPLVLTVSVSMGIMAYGGIPLDLMTLMVSSIAIGIGVDYSIHFIARLRHEIRRNANPRRAAEETIRTTGRSIIYNALTVALGFFVLVFASFKGIRFFGIQIAITMAVSALSAISIIPAILIEWQPGFLQRRTNRTGPPAENEPS